jgi:hypothetical protein
MVTTPLQLSLEFGVSQKRVRDLLRESYGTLPEGVSRWELEDHQAEAVRSRLQGAPAPQRAWALELGDTVRRREIHRAYGGQQQGGISTPRSIPEILVFTDPESGARYGYDEFEGLREDGSYAYTGEGQYGDQVFLRGNRALRDSAKEGKVIRVLRTKGVFATYVGAFTLGDPAFALETIPDLAGEPRIGIIFNLIPLDAMVDLLPAFGGELEDQESTLINYGAHPRIWTPPNYSDVTIAAQDASVLIGDERTVSRVEFQLQSDFGSWLSNAGTPPKRLPLRTGSVLIEPDMYIPERGWIVEAKKSTARGYVRTAIGQVLDYAHVARKAGLSVTPVILLPGMPESELVELISRLQITLVVRAADGFELVAPQ